MNVGVDSNSHQKEIKWLVEHIDIQMLKSLTVHPSRLPFYKFPCICMLICDLSLFILRLGDQENFIVLINMSLTNGFENSRNFNSFIDNSC